jgi:hypothetical protein
MADQPSGSVTPLHGNEYVVRLQTLSEIETKRAKWLWNGRIPLGELTLVAGREGIGKSTFLAWLAARITRGELEGEHEGEVRDVLYAASEDDWGTTIKPRMTVAGAALDRVHGVEMTHVETKQGVKLQLPRFVEPVFDEAQRIGCPVLMLDPLVSFLPENVDPWKAPDIRRPLEQIRKAGADCGVSVVVLMHFNKSSGTDILTRIAGSRAFAEVARAAIGLAKLPHDEADDPLPGPYVLSQAKNNLGRMDLPHLTYALQSAKVQAADGSWFETGRFAFVAESEISAEEALNHQPRKRRDDDGRTAEWVTEMITWIRAEGRAVATGEIVEHCRSIDPTRRPGTVRQRLSKLAEAGQLDGSLHGHYRVRDE